MSTRNDVDTRTYTVLRNEKGEHSLWLENKEVPLGWERLDFTGTVEECSAYVDKVWYVGPKRKG
ncbi:hypothetical protein GCM10010297_27980 [Streptomyces malachitofuscus]|uniref:MbtH family NRPS accessory protein n=1 Tax=unclassified Streptomyces TaxID=2593676 RepID=UPI00167E77A4|nr:MbtH family NRPS accessory protein [Streptomyces sp. NBC_00286]GGX04867.1 hypothetical protein GCM10010297_27980 [Streptomyces malachitofuscus]